MLDYIYVNKNALLIKQIVGRDKIDIGLGRIYTYFSVNTAICDSLSRFSFSVR